MMPEDEKAAFAKGGANEVEEYWHRLPNKMMFGIMFGAWVLLFQFWGNIVFGYVKTNSLFGWMWDAMKNPDDQHGVLIPFVVVGVLWWKRKELLDAAKDVWLPAMVLIILGIGFHLLGYRVQQTRFSIVGFFVGIWGMFGLVWGKEFMKRTFFPMFLFVFCVPLSTEAERITSPLRRLATALTAFVANDVMGIGVLRSGTQLVDPTGHYKYEVAAACSGIRSLIAIFAFATIYGFLEFRKTWKRVFVMLSAFPLAVIGNIVRLLCIIIAAEMFGQKGGDYVHENFVFSLLPYVPAIFGLIGLVRLLTPPEPGQTIPEDAEPEPV